MVLLSVEKLKSRIGDLKWGNDTILLYSDSYSYRSQNQNIMVDSAKEYR